MLKKTLLIIAAILLLLLPYSPVMDAFSPHLSGNTFSTYLTACCIFSLVLVLLALFVYNKKNTGYNDLPKLMLAGWLLFAMGIITVPPLHMGPPPLDETLLKTNHLEKFRFMMLMIAVIIYLLGTIAILKPLWHRLALIDKAIVIPLVMAVSISFWDYYDSYQFGAKMAAWVNDGKDAKDFFPGYNFHETWRAASRISLYINTVCLGLILLKQLIIKKWVAITLIAFGFVGIGFGFAFLAKGMAFYFPFMVPAVALAPLYWIGIALFNKKQINHSSEY